jgi:molybdenum cofactor biosynthesis enzyme MoaA
MTLTTNGSQLARFADELASCSVRRINVSLDTLDPGRFKAITRRGDLDRVLSGIDAAQRAGLSVKINVVALKGINEDEFEPMVRWARAGYGNHIHRGHPAWRDRNGPHRLALTADESARAARSAFQFTGDRPSQRRTRAVFAGRGDRRTDWLHHPADP